MNVIIKSNKLKQTRFNYRKLITASSFRTINETWNNELNHFRSISAQSEPIQAICSPSSPLQRQTYQQIKHRASYTIQVHLNPTREQHTTTTFRLTLKPRLPVVYHSTLHTSSLFHQLLFLSFPRHRPHIYSYSFTIQSKYIKFKQISNHKIKI